MNYTIKCGDERAGEHPSLRRFYERENDMDFPMNVKDLMDECHENVERTMRHLHEPATETGIQLMQYGALMQIACQLAALNGRLEEWETQQDYDRPQKGLQVFGSKSGL